jgi:hypothetical protein
MALKNGVIAVKPFLEEVENNAEKDGLITLILMSKKEIGQKKKMIKYFQGICNMVQVGVKSHEH